MTARYGPLLLACLTLGLAPFVPEPHILGKLRWVLGGGVGMGAMDYFDLALHGLPWALLLGMLGYDGLRLLRKQLSSAAE